MSDFIKYIIAGGVSLGWMVLILYLGSGQFGRDGSQKLIDQYCATHPRVKDFFNRWHGHFRASFHYIEFCTLTLLLYLLFSGLSPVIKPLSALAAWVIASIYAWVDEHRQSLTPGRQFRRQDFMHSLFGCELSVLAILLYYAICCIFNF